MQALHHTCYLSHLIFSVINIFFQPDLLTPFKWAIRIIGTEFHCYIYFCFGTDLITQTKIRFVNDHGNHSCCDHARYIGSQLIFPSQRIQYRKVGDLNLRLQLQ
jgi:hypothetical protein